MAVEGWVVWVTGLPASGKSTLVRSLAETLRSRGVDLEVLESDAARRILTPNPTYAPEERDTFYRSLIWVGGLLARHGVNVVFDATANRRAWRDEARSRFPRFMEVYVDTPLEECVRRDPKGLYGAARSGRASTVPGAQEEYEPPASPEFTVRPGEPTRSQVEKLMAEMTRRGFI